jgi:hypothetical protein
MLRRGYKIGGHWDKIPGHEEKATCNECGITTTKHRYEHFFVVASVYKRLRSNGVYGAYPDKM